MAPLRRLRLFVLLRLFAMVAALQLSGAVHGAVDLLEQVTGTVIARDCDEEDPGTHCAAGCPNCHCVGRTNVVPAETVDFDGLLVVDAGARLAMTVSDAQCRQGPPQALPYRPPRVSASA